MDAAGRPGWRPAAFASTAATRSRKGREIEGSSLSRLPGDTPRPVTIFKQYHGVHAAIDKDKEASLCGVCASGILYLRDDGHTREAAAYEEAAISEEAPDWLRLFAQVGWTIDPERLAKCLRERPKREPDHWEELGDVRQRLIRRRSDARKTTGR
jgi:hypothetical protein